MSRAFLLKRGTFDDTQADFAIPPRSRPNSLPRSGDTLFLWDNARGLIAETRLRAVSGDTLRCDDKTRYAHPIPPSWLDDADREKTTIRSKLHCDRHDRLWFLNDAEIAELDTYRRFGQHYDT